MFWSNSNCVYSVVRRAWWEWRHNESRLHFTHAISILNSKDHAKLHIHSWRKTAETMDRPTSEPTDSQTNPSGSDEAPKSEALTPSEILETPNPPTSTGDQEPAKPSSASAWSKYKKYLKNAFTTSGVIGLIQDKHITLKNSVLALVTFGLERLVDSELFDCPLEKHQVYGNCFLYVPVFLLFCANVLIIGEVWQLSGRCFIRRYRRRGDVIARLIPSGIIKALVGPAAWLIATFASGQYYVCATVGPSIAKRRNLTGNITEAEEKALVAEIDLRTADSHIYAWVVFVIITALGAATIITRNCFLKDDMLLKSKCDVNFDSFTERDWWLEKTTHPCSQPHLPRKKRTKRKQQQQYKRNRGKKASVLQWAQG